MSDDEDAVGEEIVSPEKKGKTKKGKSKTGEGTIPEKKSKKKKKDKEPLDAAATEENEDDDKKSPNKKKKKKKKDAGEDIEESVRSAADLVEPDAAGEDRTTPMQKKKKKTKVSSPDKATLDASKRSTNDNFLSPSKVKKFSPEYFESVLAETREKLDRKIKISSADRDKFLGACDNFYNAWYGKWENEQWLHQLEESNGSKDEMAEAQAHVDQSNAALPKLKNKCIKGALKIFDQLDEDKLESLEDKLVKGAIIAQSGAEELARFAEEGKENEKLIKKLFNDPELMRDMLRFGGPAKYKYGRYDDDDRSNISLVSYPSLHLPIHLFIHLILGTATP